MWNFDGVVHDLLAAGGAEQFTSPVQLEQVLRRWLDEPAAARETGRLAQAAINSNRGAVHMTWRVMEELLELNSQPGSLRPESGTPGENAASA